MEELKNGLVVFQTDSGALELRKDMDQHTVWANQADLAFLYNKDQSLIPRHIFGKYRRKELDK